ncbi:F0F1 ATP synthase subunit B family protein [Flavisphingomonas formosensis]|uniref:F0F1 ATP synthase subunit B family protein n=1 Tax=Flavisphingomonas formosensis TaxID=861534 RepID=UPI001E3D8691|nr:F0F1 ATP synthase subunit B [Sphingomonas formosensis]
MSEAAGNLAHADHLEGANATTEATVHGGSEHADPTALGLNATAWVALAMIVVIVLLLVKKVPAVIGTSLDKKIASIRKNLDEAAKLRGEAEALKAEYEKKSAAAASEAQAILASAREEADLIVGQAKTDAEALVARRAKMAEDKIAAAERAAVAEVRAKAAAAASAAAATLIGQSHDATADRTLVDTTIAGLGSARLN